MITRAEGQPSYAAGYYPPGGTCLLGTCPQHHRFTGQERDPESGLDYFGARYYAATLARFTSPDTLVGS